MEHRLKELGYLLNVEEEEGEEEKPLGGLQRRRTTYFEDSTVSADLVSVGISTVDSNISSITNEEQEPEPELEHEQAKQLEPDGSFQVNIEHLVSGAGPGDGHPVAAAGAGDVAAEGNNGSGIGEVEEEELQQSVSIVKEHESAHEHREAEHGDIGFVASREDLIWEEYDLTAEKPHGEEDITKSFHEMRDHDVGISTSWKSPIEDVCDLTIEKCETQEFTTLPSNKHENLSGLRLPSPRKPYQEETAISFIEEVEPEETEYNVAEVLEKQNTHDLFCPNCRSCITRKVILRRRRKITRSTTGARGGRLIGTSGRGETESTAEAEDRSPDVSVIAPSSDAPPDATRDRRNDRDPEVFGCLSCFTFFIPTGDCFKLFPIFEKIREVGTVQEAPVLPAAMATENSFCYLFQGKKKPAFLEDAAPENKTEEEFDSGIVDGSLPTGSSFVPSAASTVLSKQWPSVNDAMLEPTKVNGSGVVFFPNGTASGLKEPPKITDQPSTDRREPHAEYKVAVADSLIFFSPLEKLKNDEVKESEETIKESTVPASQMTPTSDTMTDLENPPDVDTQPPPSEARTSEVPEAHDFGILKSIVYGGLAESIASLGVVSSAAGGGAATLNTFALALANLITGLFFLVHNLRELKNEQSSRDQTQSNLEEDQYYQQLGRRGQFGLHATVAVISFLVLGLVAPITYGFSFRKSDNRDYKLAAVAAASLVCILLLALGKARVGSKSYIKTAVYYLVMGFAASGISFLVGELVDKLLEELRLFKSGSSSNSFSGGLRGTSLSGSGWALY